MDCPPRNWGVDKLVVSADKVVDSRITVEEMEARISAQKEQEKAKKAKPKKDEIKAEET